VREEELTGPKQLPFIKQALEAFTPTSVKAEFIPERRGITLNLTETLITKS
jgi:hypothetical protein